MKLTNNIAKTFLVVFFMLLGILGLIFPVLPGWIFIFMGLSIISKEFSGRLKQVIRRYGCHKKPLKAVYEMALSVKHSFFKQKSKPKSPFSPEARKRIRRSRFLASLKNNPIISKLI